jgi:ATP-dependent Clp protease ATP-binding subunit ClpB
MSEYMEKHSVSRLVGAPPGYVGYDEGGQLSEAVRRRPYSVVLFDEIEKAHHDVFNILLQVLDDGMITDSHGKTVSFKNTIIIMTSNIGSEMLLNHKGQVSDLKDKLMTEMRLHFRPEFLNRIDEILLFHSLSERHIEEIAGIQMEGFIARLKAKDIAVTVTGNAIKQLAKAGYDPVFGARPLKRAVVKEIETPVSRMIISGELTEGQTLKIDASKTGEFIFVPAESKKA